jgi:hypothetical protein
MPFYNTKDTYSYRRMGDKTRKHHIGFGKKMFYKVLEYAPKIYDVATRIPDAVRSYSDIQNKAEREGFREQMTDMLGSKTLTNIIFNPFTSAIMRKYGKGQPNHPHNNNGWD